MTRAFGAVRAHISVFGPLAFVGSVALIAACGSSGGGSIFHGAGGGDDAGAPGLGDSGPVVNFGDSGTSAGDDDGGSSGSVISNVTIVPANATLTVQAGQSVTQAYKVMGVLDGQGPPVDLTSRFVLWVPDNYLVGDFPTDGGPLFTSRLPVTATDPPQQGGTLTVEAEALNPGSVPITATTALTVKLQADLDTTASGADAGIPANPGQLFGGTASATRAPVLEYPNDGAMLPPNLKVLDVHWMPGSSANTLYQISFTSPTSTITYYTRCGAIQDLLANGACGFQLDATGYSYLSASNAGQGNVALTIRGTDDQGTAVGTSATFNIQFAEESVNGGVYYWDVTNTQIMRFDFGGTSTTPDVFFAQKEYGTDGTCVGCHAISPDGTKMVASEGGQDDGRMNYINDISALTPSSSLTQNQSTTSRVQFAAFDPLGTQFVSVDADGQMTNGSNSTNNLWFHDGTTGLVIPAKTKVLAFEPDHPAWSPDGTMIAMTHVGSHNTSQREYQGGIDVATFAAGSVTDAGVSVTDAGASLGDPVVVIPSKATSGTNAVNSYNPSFAPDSTFLVYSQTICPAGDATNGNCDSDIADNLTATTWAVKPLAGATPIHLDKGAKGGVADGTNTNILDSFPRSTPFQTKQGTGKLFWFTVASLRQPGLRRRDWQANQQQLWMFAVDPAKILAGQDGSYTAFFLPFQDPKTSNHIAEWTQKIVGGNPPAPVPPPPPPPPPPAPPPPK